jgi:hypothetical protein
MPSAEWEKFYGDVLARVSAFKDNWGPTAIPFFRGHGDTSWELLPGVLRANCECKSCAADGGRYIEQCLYFEYVSGAGKLLEGNPSQWDIAFSMQHYGLPTRLLDWSENFAVALFFAVDELRGNKSEAGVIWFIDPYWLNERTCGRDEILDVYDDFNHDYFNYFWADLKNSIDFPHGPAAIYPRRQNPRISAQKGGFTLHPDRRPLEELYQIDQMDGPLPQNMAGPPRAGVRLLQAFPLPRTCLADAEIYLELAGVNAYTLFPELSGLSTYLKRRYERHLR